MSTGWTAPGAAGAEGPQEGRGAPDDQDPLGAVPAGAPRPGGLPTGPARELALHLPLFPLRPLGVGEILGAAVRIYRLRARPVLVLSAAVFGVATILTGLLTGVGLAPMVGDLRAIMQESSTSAPGSSTDVFGSVGDMVLTAVSSVATSLIMLVATAVVLAPLSRIAIDAATNPSPDAPVDVWTAARRLAPTAVLTALLTNVLLVLAMLVPAVLGALPLILTGSADAVTVSLLVVGLVIGLLATVYVWARTVLSVPALAVEGLGPVAALRRSLRLTSGRRQWRVLGISVLVTVLFTIAIQVVSGVFGTIGTIAYLAVLLASSFEAIVLGITLLTIATMLGSFVAQALLAPFGAAAFAALYADVRMRDEAWDVELARAARERAGLGERGGTGPLGGHR